MPKYQHRIDSHRLFLVEQRGDTLIVAPKGDPAGFANHNFNLEHAALLALIRNESRKNLLVDLSSSNYFGAKILGAFSDWSDAVEEQGGKFALCELSPDMQELLKIFQFEGRWQQFATREEGSKAIVTETPIEVMRHHWKQSAFLVCAVMIVGMSFLPWREYYLSYLNQRDYQKVQVIWGEMQRLKTQNAPAPEWRKLQRRAQRELAPLVPDLQKRAGRQTRQTELAQYLFFAVQHNILKHLLVKQSRLSLNRPLAAQKERYWIATEIWMEKARLILNGGNPNDINFPTQIAPQQMQPQDPDRPTDEAEPSLEESHGEGPAIAEKPYPILFAPKREDESDRPDSHGEPPSSSVPNGP